MNEFEEQKDRQSSEQSLEEQLVLALARQEPPPDFTARLMARVAEVEARPTDSWWKRFAVALSPAHALRWAPALAAIVLIAGGMVYREHERAVEGLRAKQQLLEALRITNAKLRETGSRVAQVETRYEQ